MAGIMEIYFELVNDPAGLKKACDELRGGAALGFDVETTELEPYKGELRLVQLSDGQKTVVIDLRGFGGSQNSEAGSQLKNNQDLAPLRDLLASEKQVKIAA